MDVKKTLCVLNWKGKARGTSLQPNRFEFDLIFFLTHCIQSAKRQLMMYQRIVMVVLKQLGNPSKQGIAETSNTNYPIKPTTMMSEEISMNYPIKRPSDIVDKIVYLMLL